MDLLGRRLCLRILWELRQGGQGFRALQDAAETNPSVLNTRLAELKAAGWSNWARMAIGFRIRDEIWPRYVCL